MAGLMLNLPLKAILMLPARAVIVPPASWAGRIASMDRRTFGRDAWPQNVWEQELSAPDRRYLAAIQEPSAVQSLPSLIAIAGVRIAEESELLTVCVEPAYRRQGIARQLLLALFDMAREQGSCKVFLEVRAADAGAQDLYRGLGFEQIGKRRRYYCDDDAVVMAMDLKR